jgi:UDP-N-acetylmuramoyl-tripeptide--D-alanyl-D-alanine ligase
MRAALDHLGTLAGDRRRVVILGEMAELGEHSDEAHREIGAAVAAAGVSDLIAVGSRARGYAESATGVHVTLVADVSAAVEAFRRVVRPRDVVLVKGSRSAGLEAIAAKLHS